MYLPVFVGFVHTDVTRLPSEFLLISTRRVVRRCCLLLQFAWPNHKFLLPDSLKLTSREYLSCGFLVERISLSRFYILGLGFGSVGMIALA